ncbi:MAG: glycosyltransferase family 1 protein [Magnetococcales bacterium]|nr:hypothetical protein [Magnetococcales bacterium]NGZ28984.1 glycosyltransferase family 1 protein [Magnetococcales bacterium]
MAIRLWCAISGHGYGHFAQLAPILRLLHQWRPDMEFQLAGGPPTAIMASRLGFPFLHDPRHRDVGLVQQGAIQVDLPATRHALASLHHSWSHWLQEEITAMAHWRPDLVLANIPYLSLMAADHLAIPTVAIASLTWDKVITAYFGQQNKDISPWLEQMTNAYGHTQLALLPEPALPNPPFSNCQFIPPITNPGTQKREQLRQELHISPQDNRPLVFVSFGGIPTEFPDIHALAAEQQVLWLVNFPHIPKEDNLYHLDQLDHWSHSDITASVDAMVGKPGYGMVVEAVASGIPFLYLRRYTFPDEDVLCPWLHRHGRGLELDQATFWSGRWLPALQHLWSQPPPPIPAMNGAQVAAEKIISLLPP